MHSRKASSSRRFATSSIAQTTAVPRTSSSGRRHRPSSSSSRYDWSPPAKLTWTGLPRDSAAAKIVAQGLTPVVSVGSRVSSTSLVGVASSWQATAAKASASAATAALMEVAALMIAPCELGSRPPRPARRRRARARGCDVDTPGTPKSSRRSERGSLGGGPTLVAGPRWPPTYGCSPDLIENRPGGSVTRAPPATPPPRSREPPQPDELAVPTFWRYA